MRSIPSRLAAAPAALAVTLSGVVAVLLACRGLHDSDIWWHLACGEWILAHHRVPDLDPFTYASADQRYIDLSWLFQIVAALTHSAGGAAAVILLAAAVAGAAVVVAVASAPRGSAWPVVVLVWVPPLLIAGVRSVVRPELFSLLFLATDLWVLSRLDGRPRLAWVLPAVQVVWVNTHSLFVLGPAVLGMWLVDRLWRTVRPGEPPPGGGRRWWRHVGGASALVAGACLLNPYGISGATFPLVLYPKVTETGNPYKVYIEEFEPPSQVFRPDRVAGAAGPSVKHQILVAFRFFLLLIPVGLGLPALWRAARSAGHPSTPAGSAGWLGVCVGSVLLIGANAARAYGELCPGWVAELGSLAPTLIAVAGVGAAVSLARRSRGAAALAASGGIGTAAWAVVLDDYFTPGAAERGLFDGTAGVFAVAAGGCAVGLAVRHGASLFHVLLVGAFGYLGLSAVKNVNFFALVGGAAAAASLGPWAAARLAEWAPPRRFRAAGAAAVLVGLGYWVAALLVGGLPGWPEGLPPHALGEVPLKFPHDAARFAGRDGMPRRVFACGLSAANVYLYHAGPDGKPFMDGRLEVPTLDTFRTYVACERRLLAGAADWAEAVRPTGAAALILKHDRYQLGVAAVAVHPDWRLVYSDAVAAVFVRRGDPAADARIPTLDPGARHFRDPQAPSIPTEVGAAHRELLALGSLGANTADRPDATWTVRVPALLSALDRAALALDEATDPAGVWAAAGACYRSLILDPRRPPASPSDRWDPVAGVRWAQATYCLRRAQRADPADPRALYELHESFRARRMADAQRTVGREWLAADALPPDLAESIRRHADRVGPPIRPRGTTEPGRVLELLRSGRPEDATGFAEALGRLPWEPAEAVAGAWLHLGEPGKARGVWQAATGAPSEAVRSARVGSTYWVERDYAAAERAFADAQRADPDLAEPCWALAWLYAETGRADRAAAEARNALARRPSPRAREELEPLLAFLARYVERTGQ